MVKSDKEFARPLGATDGTPLVVLTADIAKFLRRYLTVGRNGRTEYDKVTTPIKLLKARGSIVHGVGYDVLKKINEEARPVTADNCAETILLSQGQSSLEANDIPLYRTPYMPEWKYVQVMRQRLRRGWDVELDGEWDEEEHLAYIHSFPSI